MIRQFAKGYDEPLSKDFHVREFHCRCSYPDCQITYISEELVAGLQKLRDLVGEIVINDGFRCPMHNSDVLGRPHSYHTLGMAADCWTRNKTVEVFAGAATVIPQFLNGGIGIYPLFVHVDARGHKARWRG